MEIKSNTIIDVDREKEIQLLCDQVLNASPDRDYHYYYATCPFCGNYVRNENADIGDVDHELDCYYLIAKSLKTNLDGYERR